jgi:hypothetical protein
MKNEKELWDDSVHTRNLISSWLSMYARAHLVASKHHTGPVRGNYMGKYVKTLQGIIRCLMNFFFKL